LFFLQEIKGACDPINEDLVKILLGWSFLGLDVVGSLRGLSITDYNYECDLINNFVVPSGLFTKIHFKKLDHSLPLLNLYGPYADREEYWNHLLDNDCILSDSLIMGGDKNLTLNREEVWG
jgi:hypothetical protein